MLNFDFYQNMLTIFTIIVGWLLIFSSLIKKQQDIKIVTLIYIWHTLFSILYFTFTLFNSSDARKYYRVSLESEFLLYPGSTFIRSITAIYSHFLNASYLNATLFFNIFGSLGLVLLYFTLKKYIEKLSKHWLLIFFIPSMSFWSAGLGKDAISFFAVCLFLYAIVESKKTAILVPIAFFFMFMVRPHIAFMMLVSYVIYFIIQSRVYVLFKLLILPAIFAGLFLSLGFVQQYVGLEEASLNSVGDYVEGRQDVNQGGGSSLDIKSMSYPLQMFTYIFRPLPFEAHSALALFTSIENTIMLFLFLYIICKSKFKFGAFVEGKHTWLLIYAFLACTMLALTTANLGIATRQKWMFMPILIYLLVYAFYKHKNKYRLST